jgi:probable phosphoglycerate mutase
MARPRSGTTVPPTLVLFVRHGATPTTGRTLPGRAPGLHLSAKGTEQAEAVAQRLGGIPNVDAVYASPMERTRETAAPIAKALGLRVRSEPGLIECDFGSWTGASLARLRRKKEWRTVQANPSGFRFPGGESFHEMQARITDAARRLVERHPGRAIVAVSHADPIKAVAADALGSHLDHFQRLVVSPCSVTAILYTETAPVVLALNSVDDLGNLKPS